MLFKTCRVCHKSKPISEFYKRKKHGAVIGVRNECKECTKKYKHNYYLKHKDERREYNAKYREENKEKLRRYNQKYYQENRKKLIEKSIKRSKKWSQKIKKEVLSHYSHKNYPVCKKCGETDMRVLSIDHINGDGAKHRREIFGENKKSGRHFYKWLQENDYPDGFQVLCMNCQWIKRYENKELSRK